MIAAGDTENGDGPRDKLRSKARRRANGEGTVFQRSNGRWVGQCTAPPTSLSKGRRITVYGSTQKQARENLKAEMAALERGRPRPAKVPTVAEYGAKHFDSTLPNLVATGHNSPRTVAFYSHLWTTHVQPFLGHHRLNELTPDVLRDWQSNRAKAVSAHTGKALSARTQQAIYGTLRTVLNEAIRDGHIDRHPLSATGVRAPKGQPTRVRPYSEQVITALLQEVAGTWLHSLLVLMYLTGARPGEALGVMWGDLDLEARVWHISRTVARVPNDGGQSTVLGFAAPKTLASDARIRLPQFAVDALRAQQERQAGVDTELVFSTRRGGPLALGNVLRKLKTAAARAGIEDEVTLHRFRHTAATALLEEGVSIVLTSKLLRHSRLQTTSDIYSHTTERLESETADIMDARYMRLHQTAH